MAGGLAWCAEEVCHGCWHCPLQTVVGSGVDGLPMEQARDDFMRAISGRCQVLGLQGATGSGKTMLAPGYLLSRLKTMKHAFPCVCLVQDSVYSARQVVASLVDRFGWSRDRIQLRSSVDTRDQFCLGSTVLTVINYGILWQWVKTGHRWWQRYGGIILDEFASFGPLREFTARMIFVEQKRASTRDVPIHIVATSASLSREYLKDVGGIRDDEFEFLSVDARKFTMERCMVIPEEESKVLESMAKMVVAALKREETFNSGSVIAFLPGFAEIVSLEQLVSKELGEGLFNRSGEKVKVEFVKVHSETIDDEEEDVIWDSGIWGGAKLVVLASRIAAKSVTLPSLQYAFLHPKSRDKVLHASGLERLWDEYVDDELANQQSGRVARVSPGLVTFFDAVDDTPLALRALDQGFGLRPGLPTLSTLKASLEHVPRSFPLGTLGLGHPRLILEQCDVDDPFVTIVCGIPERLPLVMNTMMHLRQRGFPNLFWLRTPGPADLDEVCKVKLRPCTRVMLFWSTTVLPCVKRLETLTGCQNFLSVRITWFSPMACPIPCSWIVWRGPRPFGGTGNLSERRRQRRRIGMERRGCILPHSLPPSLLSAWTTCPWNHTGIWTIGCQLKMVARKYHLLFRVFLLLDTVLPSL